MGALSWSQTPGLKLEESGTGAGTGKVVGLLSFSGWPGHMTSLTEVGVAVWEARVQGEELLPLPRPWII